MQKRVSEVVIAHHHRLFASFDAVAESLTTESIASLEKELERHLAVEDALVYPHLSDPWLSLRHGTEEHAVLTYAMDRVVRGTSRERREARLRVARDLFVAHIEHEERVTLPTLELTIGATESRRLADLFLKQLRLPGPR